MADISNILAALAQSQRQGGTSSQPPPPVPGSAYPPPQYATPPGGATPYGLPQPISSGSVDLANVKPIGSGLMSLGDKGRYEADRGELRGLL
jgi:far upstream element-binding protein